MRILTTLMLLILLQGCCWPQAAWPTYSQEPNFVQLTPRPRDGTFEHRLQTKLYDAANKVNKSK